MRVASRPSNMIEPTCTPPFGGSTDCRPRLISPGNDDPDRADKAAGGEPAEHGDLAMSRVAGQLMNRNDIEIKKLMVD
jgi:hypothetical protein